VSGGRAGAQFTELEQKEQLAKLASAREALATAGTKKFKFVSGVNDQARAQPWQGFCDRHMRGAGAAPAAPGPQPC
jgi:hypothetical protein